MSNSLSSSITSHTTIIQSGMFSDDLFFNVKVSIRNRHNQVPHLTQDTNGKVTNSQLDTTNESQEISPFPAGDHKAKLNRRADRHNKHKTEKHKRSTKDVPRTDIVGFILPIFVHWTWRTVPIYSCQNGV